MHTYIHNMYIYIYRIRWMDSWSTQAIPVKRGLPIGVARSTVSDWSATSPSEFFAWFIYHISFFGGEKRYIRYIQWCFAFILAWVHSWGMPDTLQATACSWTSFKTLPITHRGLLSWSTNFTGVCRCAGLYALMTITAQTKWYRESSLPCSTIIW